MGARPLLAIDNFDSVDREDVEDELQVQWRTLTLSSVLQLCLWQGLTEDGVSGAESNI